MGFRVLVVAGVFVCAGVASAGNIYQITAKDGDKTITYEVRFGRGRLTEVATAFDPESSS